MRELNHILGNATAAVDARYFLLGIDGGPSVYRERVYCYELYHQLRKRWPRQCPYILNGEVDKAGHPIFGPLGLSGLKPDLLIHQPADMAENHAVIEVKTSQTGARGIRKDLLTLKALISRAGYRRGIYLIYGDRADGRLVNRVRGCARTIPDLPCIELWLHQVAGGRAALHSLVG